jgi:hypothetical protein
MKITKAQRRVLIAGGAIVATFYGLVFVLRKTSWIDKPPLECRVFPTKADSYGGKVEVCLGEIIAPANPDTEDALIHLVVKNPRRQRVTDVAMQMGVPHPPGKKFKVLWRIDRVQRYNRQGVLVADSSVRFANTSDRLGVIPADATPAIWLWATALVRTYPDPLPDHESVVDDLVAKFATGFATASAMGLTAWRFIQAAGE